MKQVVKPNTNVKVLAGQCQKLARTVFGAPPKAPSAWEGWKHAIGRHVRTSHPKSVSVPIWFSHYGTYGTPPRYGNWGHVVVYVPGRGYLSSPGSGFGNKWFQTIGQIERYFNCKLAGWSEGINGVRVVKKDPTPKPPPTITQEDDMVIYIRENDQARVYARSVSTGKNRGLSTLEWNATKRAYAAAGLTLPIIDLTAAEAKEFNI